ncbi:ELWxxDGT repeat protein [Kordia sp. SMS9]|uniref:T9SS type A sorting domain-containing protein n=1 Tax=Kordia sp. SMS9 TaxID=2282170 RepID=UPI000E0CCAA1|nr:T9SS type A sorting domain-containing protein [Kordia sp. SMS9]AXG70642.1 ELWxxDGT repeat protein [Kordia sp. SMS9]
MKNILLGLLALTTLQIHAQYTFEQIDIWSGSNGSSPKYITEMNGELYFQSIDITPSFKKLYKSDGTAAGTQLVAGNLNSGAGYSPESLYVMNGELYFTAFVSGIGTELYKTDGTDAGTILLKDVRTGSSSGLDFNTNDDNQLFVEYNNELYFRGSTNSSIELWKTDGTPTGTISIKNFEDAQNGAPTFMTTAGKNILGTVYNGLLYFYVNRNGNGELWKTDGTTANTELVRSSLKNIAEMMVFNNQLYFVSGDDSYAEGRELWVSDGTFAGTTVKHDIFPNNLNPAFGFGSNPSNLIIFNNELYFKARSYSGTSGQIIGSELWKTNGTTASLVKDIDTDNLASGLNIPNFTSYNNELYFTASDNTTSDFELWKTDGTESGTVKVVSATDTGESIEFTKAINYAGKLFYFDSQQLWVTDGTPSGTTALTGNSEEILLISTSSLVKYQNKLWFDGNKSGNGNELTSLEDASVLSTATFTTETIAMYPNPASHHIHFTNISNASNYRIYNTLGSLIQQGNLQNAEKSIDVSAIAAGMYVVEITMNTQSKTFKLLKN